MGSRISKMFRGLVRPRAGPGPAPGSEATIEYHGYTIRPASFQEGSHWVTAAVISKAFPDGLKEHRFVRADMFPAKDSAEEFAVVRAKRAIDELGDSLFDADEQG